LGNFLGPKAKKFGLSLAGLAWRAFWKKKMPAGPIRGPGGHHIYNLGLKKPQKFTREYIFGRRPPLKIQSTPFIWEKTSFGGGGHNFGAPRRGAHNAISRRHKEKCPLHKE